MPVHGRHGDSGLLSITSDAGERDWQRLRLHYMRDFQVLALHLHEVIPRLDGTLPIARAPPYLLESASVCSGPQRARPFGSAA